MATITSKAPLLKPLRTSGSTFITFSQAINDLSLMLGDSDVRCVPSKFALLKLPEWKNVVGDQHMYEDPVNIGLPLVSDPNTIFPKVVQNYMENMMQYSDQERTDIDYDTISEVSFWKMLRRLGALELVSDGADVIDGQSVDTYREADESATYERVIKYIGEVNALNHVKKYGREYIEVFAHVPTSVGQLTKVRFIPKAVTHAHAQIPDGGGGVETIGLEDFDNDQNYAIYDNINSTYSVDNDLELASIDFDYHLANDQFKNQGNFEFNCVALFADTFDKTDSNTRRTNLMGILLLEPFDNTGISNIPTLKKYQPDETQAGNSNIFQFNINLSTQTDQVTSDVIINDYSTVSMHMYVDALEKLTETALLFEQFETDILAMKTKITALEQILLNYNNLNTMIAQITTNKNNIDKLFAGQDSQGSTMINNNDLLTIVNSIESRVSALE